MSQPETLSAADRPSRLPLWAHIATVVLVALAFLTGVVLLYYDVTIEDELARPAWLHNFRVVHGCLYPFQCVFFGYLLCQHIRYGWGLKINRVSGFAMEGCFAGLILTGLGLHYIGSDT